MVTQFIEVEPALPLLVTEDAMSKSNIKNPSRTAMLSLDVDGWQLQVREACLAWNAVWLHS